MASLMNVYEHLNIQLKEIKLATNDFDEKNVIGIGGFGKVYEGELCHSHSEKKSLVALKRLDRKHGQGDPQFWKEIMMLSQYRHINLISLLGFCNEEGEMILVYEHASRGSLERHLNDVTLTWTQRIKICIDAANGLSFLHEPNERQQRVLHCDIKSANILLDDNLNAKVSDFGLSKMGSTGPQYSVIITNAVGTPGYCDPLYMETYQLTKESDVYSFGVVLFEVLSGKLCVENIRGQLKVYVPFWKQSYEQEKIEGIVLEGIKQQMNQSSLEVFAGIAYQCLQKSREERPTMSLVVEKLEIALQMQMLPKEYVVIANAAVDPLICRSLEEFKELLSKGVLLNRGKTWLSLNDKEEHHVMVSIEEYLSLDDPNRDYSDQYSSKEKSRFAVGCYKTCLMEFKLRVTAPLFLSPDVTYGLNLIFHASEIERMKQQYVGVRYKIQGETKVSILSFADKKEGKEFVAELYQFNSTEGSILDLEIFLEDCGLSGDYYIEGIEFRPMEKVEHQVVTANQEIVRGVIPPLLHGFTEEWKVVLSQGVLLNGGKTWLSITEKGDHIERIYIDVCLNPSDTIRLERSSRDIVSNSRFSGGQCRKYNNRFEARVRGQNLKPQISYTANLVFRYEDESEVNKFNLLRYKLDDGEETKVFIIYPTYMRQDGWFIAPLYQFTSQHETADLQFKFEDPWKTLLVAGFEFQPSEEKVELQQYQDIVDLASQSLSYTSLYELKQILSKGVLLNGGKMWFSLNEKGEHCLMISMEDCLIPNEGYRLGSYSFSRFPAGMYHPRNKGFKTHVKTQLLSPLITYTVYLVLMRDSSYAPCYVNLKYRLRGETTTCSVYLAYRRQEDPFFLAELFQFTSNGSIFDLEINFDSDKFDESVEGILLQPLEKVEDQVSKDDMVENIQTISDLKSDTYREQKFPDDYKEMLKLSKYSQMWKTKKQLYSILRRGFLIDGGQQWFVVDKHGKKCLMLSARSTFSTNDKNSAYKSSRQSRFGEVLVLTAGHEFDIWGMIKPEVVSRETKYAGYLVYKLPQDQSTFEAPMFVWDRYDSWPEGYIYLVSPPNTPVIGQKFDENSYKPPNTHKLVSLPRQRSDGWMEVKMWEFETRKTSETVKLTHVFRHACYKDLCGLIIHGITLRPI